MQKMLFLSQEMCVERWERWSESDRFSTEATVGGLSGDACGLCHPGPFPERRDRKWPGILGGYKPSSVCLYQTAIRYFIQMRSKHSPLPQRAWRDVSERFCILIIIIQLIVALFELYFSPAAIDSGTTPIPKTLGRAVKH